MSKNSIKSIAGQGPAAASTHSVQIARGLVRRDGRAADVVAFEEQVIGFFIEAADLIGAPKSVAAIYGICFASAEPLGFAEIQGRLDISVGSISQGLRVLKEVGALKVVSSARAADPSMSRAGRPRQRENGSMEASNGASAQALDRNAVKHVLARSRERFEPDLELRKLVLHWIEKRLQKQLSSGSSRLERLLEAVPSGADAETLRERLGALQTWHDKSHALMPIVKTFLKLT